MRKSDKKIENKLRISLTKVCETALNQVEGFQWLTHLVDYNNFPQSLSIICVFDLNESLAQAKSNNKTDYLKNLIEHELVSAGFKIRNTHSLVKFDTEENTKFKNDCH